MIDYTRLLERLNPDPGGEGVTRIRNGVVDAINLDGTLDVEVSGVAVVPDVPRLESARPSVGDTVVMITYLGQPLIIGVIASAPPSVPVFDRDANRYENFNASSFTPTANAPVITFWVPRSGRGKIDMFVRADADAIDERFQADVEIRASNSGGSVVHSPTSADGGLEWFWDPDFPSFTNFYGGRALEPLSLSPGQYWAQLQIDTVSVNIDIADQWIRFQPE